ncbi:DUF3618 domain-containing protein [Schaalia sp. 19OD2882]|uniref:DUF3618 domain-containing protein n=1 Tax=Schaalia sp. 19OD2882 TaxID=2794089 RepID=UPI001C1EEE73|nr:DUF3618 domain-containing protein [Schaalia sp. 19OD2882]QWW19765.1 DUF3618 domain-containing protein [Schaalia sp. 19OD2882]
MNENARARTPQEIEAELAATREEMTRTVDALVGQLQPAYQIEQAKRALADKAQTWQSAARTWLQDFGVKVSETIDQAREGQPEAVKKVGAAAACALVLAGLLAIRFTRRR